MSNHTSAITAVTADAAWRPPVPVGHSNETWGTFGQVEGGRLQPSGRPAAIAAAVAAASSSLSAASSSAPAQPARAQRVVIVPGNGCGKIERANWYINVKRELEARGYDARCKAMPDPNEAKEKIWLPFMEKELGADEHSIVIGHSSGAEAGMRYAETHRIKGLILVSACHTDMGMPSETVSGYYSRPWLWNDIKKNCDWIVQLHSLDDPFIPIEEARHVAQNLKSEYIEHTNRNHYMSQTLPDVIEIVEKKCAGGK